MGYKTCEDKCENDRGTSAIRFVLSHLRPVSRLRGIFFRQLLFMIGTFDVYYESKKEKEKEKMRT